MKFTQALKEMKKGKSVRLPNWVGYWFISDNTIIMHCSDGINRDIRDSENMMTTMQFIARDDWQIASNGIEDTIHYMDFSEALHHLKIGNKVCRDGWNGKNMFVVYQKGYPDGIPCNKQTAEAWGIKEGDLFKCNPYLQIKNVDGSHSMWVPSVGDLIATDWRLCDSKIN